MDDPNAFERQLGRVLQGAAGPSRPTDVAGMVRVATTPSRSPLAWLFGATRLAVAGAIVALFGGFLVLSLLLTDDGREGSTGASPRTSPVAIERLRDRLETEIIAPGVERVLDDGADHELTRRSEDPEGRGFDHVAVGPDGAVWLYRPSGELFRLGQDGAHSADPYFEGGIGWLDHTPDGTLAGRDGRGQLVRVAPETVAGTAWSEPLSDPQRRTSFWNDEHLAKVAPDGAWPDALASDLAEQLAAAVRERDFVPYPDDIWEVIGEDMGEPCAIAVTSDGAPWGGACGVWGMGWGGGALARYLDGTWHAVQPLAGTENADVFVSDVFFLSPGADATLWAAAWMTTFERLRDAYELAPAAEEWRPGTLVGPVLMRLQDGQWSVFPLARVTGNEQILDSLGAIGVTDASGRLWLGAGDNIGLGRDGDLGELPGKAALLSFDGETTRWHPDVGVIRDIELAEDGSLWVAGEDGVFIIDPDRAHASATRSSPAPRYAVTDGMLDAAGVTLIEPGVVQVSELGGLAVPEIVSTVAYGRGPAIYESIAIGSDGTVVLGDRLAVDADGEARTLELPEGATDLDVAKDGTIWHASSQQDSPALFGSVGEEPWSGPSTSDTRGPTHIEVHPDGTVIGAWRNPDGETIVARLWDRSWSPIGTPIPGAIDALRVSDGEVWIEQGTRILNADWEGRAWRDIGEKPPGTVQFDVGTTSLPRVLTRQAASVSIGRYYDHAWEFDELALEDGYVPFPSEAAAELDDAFEHGGPFEEAPDGSIWFALAGPRGSDGVHTCAGLAHVVDGAIDRYLDGECIGAMEVVVDGSVWVQSVTDIDDGFPIYVIRP